MVSPFLLVCFVTSLSYLSQVLGQPVCSRQEQQPEGSSGPAFVFPSDPSPSDSGHMLVTTDADEARNTALCHIACINLLYASGTNCTDDTDRTFVRFSIIYVQSYFAVCNGNFTSISLSATPQPPENVQIHSYKIIFCIVHQLKFYTVFYTQGLFQLDCRQFEPVSEDYIIKHECLNL